MKKIILHPVTLTILLLGTLIIYVLSMNTFFSKMSDRGLFGDMFGGINTLFSGLAFLGVIYTISLQSDQLQVQKSELETTREELKRTTEAQIKSADALKAQVESMEKTVELNGLNSILQYLGSSLVSATTGNYHDADQRDIIKKEAEIIKKQIEDAIKKQKNVS